MIEKVLMLYQQKFLFDRFYDNLLYGIKTSPGEYIPSNTFLSGYEMKTDVTEKSPPILTQNGDVRVDLPVWFGNPKAENKIVIIGLEPRDTVKSGHLNIERVGNFVFGTPFALERPVGHYHSAFRELMNTNETFIYFTDVVKTYHVNNSENKLVDDKVARKLFWEKAEENKMFLLEEIETIKPARIIALGNDSFNFLNKLFGDKYSVQKVRHPSQGGATLAREQLRGVLQSMAYNS